MSIEKIKEIFCEFCTCNCTPQEMQECTALARYIPKYSALIAEAKEQARKEERQKMIDEGWISPEECNACNKRQIESERILNREAAFDEERLRDEVKYWKSKNYQLGS